MKKPFAVGDRVRVYSGQDGIMVGVVEGADDVQVMVNIPGKKGLWLAHVKQCRRLVPRKPAREWTLFGHPSSCTSNYVHKPVMGPDLEFDEVIRVREVRPKK